MIKIKRVLLPIILAAGCMANASDSPNKLFLKTSYEYDYDYDVLVSQECSSSKFEISDADKVMEKTAAGQYSISIEDLNFEEDELCFLFYSGTNRYGSIYIDRRSEVFSKDLLDRNENLLFVEYSDYKGYQGWKLDVYRETQEKAIATVVHVELPDGWEKYYAVFGHRGGSDYSYGVELTNVDGWGEFEWTNRNHVVSFFGKNWVSLNELGNVLENGILVVDRYYEGVRLEFPIQRNVISQLGYYSYSPNGYAPDISWEYFASPFVVDDYNGRDIYIVRDVYSQNKWVVRYGSVGKKTLHILPPQTEKWMGKTLVLKDEETKKTWGVNIDKSRCGWYTLNMFEEDLPSKAILLSSTGDTIVWGKNGSEKMFDLKKLLAESDESYFVASGVDGKYLFDADPELDGICKVNLRGIVYDTDASLHPAFSCYDFRGEGCQEGAQGVDSALVLDAINACIGLTPGIVEPILGKDGKPVLSKSGRACFMTDEFFSQLFHSTEGVNETSCFDIPMSRNSVGKLEFNSDYYTSPGADLPGGFYPTENVTDKDIVVGSPLEAARTKRSADGPTFLQLPTRQLDSVELETKFNLMCGGPGWKGVIDCTGKFADGEDINIVEDEELFKYFDKPKYGCIWGWCLSENPPDGWPVFGDQNNSYRWEGERRNQHYCFESHAKFTYKKGLRFGVRGDDDIWVFIGKKLALDLGGTHLAAPGYVDLDQISDWNGNALKVGGEYPIDIFFCDRRTAMSNMNIYSNFYLNQSDVADEMGPCAREAEHIFDDDPLSPRYQKEDDVVESIKKIVVQNTFGVNVLGKTVAINGVLPGTEISLLDLKGRVVRRMFASVPNMKFTVSTSGRYIVNVGGSLKLIAIK